MFYKGWVPTVNGRLSFKLIGETRYPAEPEYVNSADGKHLYVAALQSRQLSDVLFEPIMGPLLGYSGKFQFILCARSRRIRTSPDSKLIGKVFIFHCRAFKESKASDIFRSSVKSMRALDPGAVNPGLKQQYLALNQALLSRCDMCMDVVLNRDGVIALSRLTWGNSHLERNTEEHAGEIGFDLEHGIADQIYFFVRDLTHQHQHHGNDADTIITTQRQERPDDLSWCLEIMYSLYFHIITVKRKENPTEHVRALGILAYLQSYKNIIKHRKDIVEATLVLPEFDDASSKESIKATKDYIDFKLTEQKRNSDNRKSFFLWVVATVFTIVNFTVGFADKALPPNPTVASVANFLKTNAYVLPALAIAALIYLASNLISKPRYDFKRDVVRMSIAGRIPAVAIALVLGAGMLAVCVFFVINLLSR
ncbi:hypothetical protein [Rhizobium rhizogenes]|jgi:hypothetical protein|uniref:hypothetical protein n=1 Tax=Rhizobium rhizogenes TaxID=359 RepID=UPI00157379A4|nr:hypothetical protein [Rhizobium rhizogenes]NTI33086.1 hypothetical protein [Rhizobium rhizogenes]WEO64796.1 hypothetical protein G6L54_017380 [Rhizobium rhizogenes]